jgi:hypothetical protein
MSSSILPLSVIRQLTSSSNGENMRCIWKLTARARVWRSRWRVAFSRRLERYSLPTPSRGRCFSSFDLLLAAVIYVDLQVHLGFAVQALEIALKLALIGADGLTKGFIILENGAKTERKTVDCLKQSAITRA